MGALPPLRCQPGPSGRRGGGRRQQRFSRARHPTTPSGHISLMGSQSPGPPRAEPSLGAAPTPVGLGAHGRPPPPTEVSGWGTWGPHLSSGPSLVQSRPQAGRERGASVGAGCSCPLDFPTASGAASTLVTGQPSLLAPAPLTPSCRAASISTEAQGADGTGDRLGAASALTHLQGAGWPGVQL